MSVSPHIQSFFDEPTNTVTYLVSDPLTHSAAVIDPVLDYEHRSGQMATHSAQRILVSAREQGLKIEWVLETHAHADHLSAAPYIKKMTGAKLVIGEHIREVQRIFSPIFNLEDVSGEGAEFDKLVSDGEHFKIGELDVEVMHTPGHTPACVAYRIGGDAVFVGDTMFMPDYGTARADFPGGDARTLYRSIQRLLALPPETRLYMCHDYKAPGRDVYAWQSTVAQQRTFNVHVHAGVSEQAFVDMREARDATLAAPMLLLPSVQVNIRAGELPRAEDNGVQYLKIPLRPQAPSEPA